MAPQERCASEETPFRFMSALTAGGLRTPGLTPAPQQARPRIPALALPRHTTADDASLISTWEFGDDTSYASTSDFTASMDSRSHTLGNPSRMASLDAASLVGCPALDDVCMHVLDW